MSILCGCFINKIETIIYLPANRHEHWQISFSTATKCLIGLFLTPVNKINVLFKSCLCDDDDDNSKWYRLDTGYKCYTIYKIYIYLFLLKFKIYIFDLISPVEYQSQLKYDPCSLFFLFLFFLVCLCVCVVMKNRHTSIPYLEINHSYINSVIWYFSKSTNLQITDLMFVVLQWLKETIILTFYNNWHKRLRS